MKTETPKNVSKARKKKIVHASSVVFLASRRTSETRTVVGYDEASGRAVLDCGHKMNSGARVGLKHACVACSESAVA
jgi:hypothetical protein